MRTDAAQLLVFAGRVPEGHTQDLWLFDLEQNRWVLVPVDGDSPQGRDGHDAVWLAGRETMLVFGGRFSGEFDDLWEMALTS